MESKIPPHALYLVKFQQLTGIACEKQVNLWLTYDCSVQKLHELSWEQVYALKSINSHTDSWSCEECVYLVHIQFEDKEDKHEV